MSQIVLHLKVIKLLLTELTANVSRIGRDIPGFFKYQPAWRMYHEKYREKLTFDELFERSQMT